MNGLAKPSSFMQRQRAELNTAVAMAKRWHRGLCQDVACKAAHDVFGIGPKRILEFMARYCEILREADALLQDDRREDRDMVYSKAKWDEVMRKVYELPGDDHWMPDFDERMGVRLLTEKEMKQPLEIPMKQAELFEKKMGMEKERE